MQAKIKFSKNDFEQFKNCFLNLTLDCKNFDYLDFYNLLDFSLYLHKKSNFYFFSNAKNINIQINLNQFNSFKNLFENKFKSIIKNDIEKFTLLNRFYEECTKQFEQIENLIYKSKL